MDTAPLSISNLEPVRADSDSRTRRSDCDLRRQDDTSPPQYLKNTGARVHLPLGKVDEKDQVAHFSIFDGVTITEGLSA
jgi:hypothetical protein